MLRAAARVALACVPMVAWGIASQMWWEAMGMPSLAGRVAVLVAQLAGAAGLFVLAAAALRCEELHWAWDLVRRKMRRRGRPERG